MGKNRICWVTSSFLLDVDIPIVPQLQKDYDIDWIVLKTMGNKNLFHSCSLGIS